MILTTDKRSNAGSSSPHPVERWQSPAHPCHSEQFWISQVLSNLIDFDRALEMFKTDISNMARIGSRDGEVVVRQGNVTFLLSENSSGKQDKGKPDKRTKETDNGTWESCSERSEKVPEERCNTELDISQDFDVVPAELACEQHNEHGEGGSGELFGKSETGFHHDDQQPERGPITPVSERRNDRRVMAEYPWLAPLCNLPVDTLFNVCLEVGNT